MPAVLTPEAFGPLRIWAEPRESCDYVIGADTAGGAMAEDYCAAFVIEMASGDHVATWHGKAEPRDFGDVVIALGTYYGGASGQALVVPEINNHGIVVLERLRDAGHWNLYTRQVWDSIDKVWKPQLGWTTSMKTRPMLISRMKQALRDGNLRIRDPLLLEECSTFVQVINKDGNPVREDHMPGYHDDILFAAMMAYEGRWVAYESGKVDLDKDRPKQKEPEERAWQWEAHDRLVERSILRHQLVDEGVEEDDLAFVMDEEDEW